MQYSASQIANLALIRIGARGDITSLQDASPNAVKVNAIWDVIFQEVLSERDWKFAKTRVALQLSPNTPLYAYRFAWSLPSDFLRFVRPHKRPANLDAWLWGPEGWGYYDRNDPPFRPNGYSYIVETIGVTTGAGDSAVTTYNKYVLCDYDGVFCGPAAINYIRLISDYSQLMPGFVNCLANRLAMELTIGVTEDKQKFQMMKQQYLESMNSAEAQNESSDFVENEAGSYSWVRAGRGC